MLGRASSPGEADAGDEASACEDDGETEQGAERELLVEQERAPEDAEAGNQEGDGQGSRGADTGDQAEVDQVGYGGVAATRLLHLVSSRSHPL